MKEVKDAVTLGHQLSVRKGVCRKKAMERSSKANATLDRIASMPLSCDAKGVWSKGM